MAQLTQTALTAARALIANREHWTQGNLAIDNTGAAVLTSSEHAYAFCALGAVRKVCGDEGVMSMACSSWLERAALDNYQIREIACLNDNELGTFIDDEATHAGILRLFDHAIALAAT